MNLNELRDKINQIDQQMLILFKNRMEISKLIGEYKKSNNLPILDTAREKEILNNKKLELNDEILWKHYEKFIKNLMDISKEYQNE
jgi:monofunctional chorismate mutase